MSGTPQIHLLPDGDRRPVPPQSATHDFFERNQFVAIAIFVLTVAAIVAISFAGLNPVALPIQPNQPAQARVEAAESFTYESQIMTEQARTRLLARVPPVYQLDHAACDRFEKAFRALLADLTQVDRSQTSVGKYSPAPTLFDEICQRFNSQGPYLATPADIAAFYAYGDAAVRSAAAESGLSLLRELYQEGIQENPRPGSHEGIMLLQLRRPGGEISESRVQSVEDALTYLRVNLNPNSNPADRAAAHAFFRLLRNGVTPNLVFDTAGSEQLRRQAIVGIPPVLVTVESGQAIIQPGERVTPAQYEMLQAYRTHLDTTGRLAAEQGYQLFVRVLLVMAMVIASILYIRLEDHETLQSNSRLGLLALVVIVNLLLVRLSYSLASLPFFITNFDAAALLPYVAPTAFAPLIVAILIDAGSAIFMALLISIFTGIIYGHRLDLVVLTLLASMVGIYSCRALRRRSRIIQAAVLGGFVVAGFAVLIGFANQTSLITMLFQVAAGLLTGLATGIAVAGLLPVLENLFKRTTDITLLELTDYNHPLLHRMQLTAPGTYHHSLVVAQLSENAASAIHANPLLGRVCALFHDIGKMEQPEYFTENQRDAGNPHDKLPPVQSAAIIKSHVDRGAVLAQQHHLPRAIVDVIHQHHGTTLIQFFHRLACQQAPSGRVAEADFRYAGPRPRFKESAIISLADKVEAATRSLRTVTPRHLSELIDRLFQERITDEQLDEAPLTFEELVKIKTSFTVTLLNMLHTRVAYAGAEPLVAPRAIDSTPASDAPASHG